MNNLIKVGSLLLAGLSFSTLGHAQAVNEYGNLESSGTIATTDCTVLGTATSITLSKNSVLAFQCSPLFNQVVLRTCNSAGSRTAETVQCQWTQDATGSSTYTPTGSTVAQTGFWNGPGCTGTSTTDLTDIAGGRFFTLSSAGGSMAKGGGAATDACDGATLEAGLSGQ